MYTYLFLRAHTSSSPPSVHIPHFHFFCLAIARISSFAVVIVSAACSVLAEDNAGTDVPAPTSTPLAYADDDGNLHLTVPGGKAVTAKGALSGDDGDATEGTVNVIQKINELKRRLANLKEKRSGTQKSLRTKTHFSNVNTPRTPTYSNTASGKYTPSHTPSPPVYTFNLY